MKRPIPPGQPTGRPAVRSIAEEWRTYALEVLSVKEIDGRLVKVGPAANELRLITVGEAMQLSELRRAFYGGASALYALTVFGLGDETISQDEAAKLLETVGDEILAFSHQEGRGRK